MEETLGKRISLHRKRLGLTQDVLAEKLGVTAQAVSKWENNQSYPDITMLPKLAEIFDTTIDELLGVKAKETEDLLAESATKETEAPVQEAGTLRKAWVSPGAAFVVWLFLTGLVLCVTKMRNMLCEMEDIVIACGVFAFGLYGFFRKFSLLRLGCAAAGGIFVLQLLLDTSIADIDWTVPLGAAVALFGLDLLIDSLGEKRGAWRKMPEGHLPEASVRNYCTYDGDRFDCAACFGTVDQLIHLPKLAGGRGEATFGQLTIDLRGCSEIGEGCTIDLRCGFGSLNILVPRKYRVKTVASSAFGVVEEKGTSLPETQETVYLNCRVSFGQIMVRYI